MGVVETIEHAERVIDGKTLPVTITRRKGLTEYVDSNGATFWADEATYIDYGPRLGITRTYVKHPEQEPTEGERAANRARIREAATRAMIEQRIW